MAADGKRYRWGLFLLYFRFLRLNIRSLVEYRGDFILMFAASALSQSLPLAFYGVLFSRVPDIQGWSFWQIGMLFAMMFITEGAVSVFFEGVQHTNRLIHTGQLDKYILRPLPISFQLVCTAVNLTGLWNIGIGTVLMFQCIQQLDNSYSIGILFLIPVAMIIRALIYFIAQLSGFFIPGHIQRIPYMIHSLSDYVRYPLTIYPLFVQVILSTLIPYAFISYYPVTWATGKSPFWMILAFPAVIVVLYFLARHALRLGLRKYESAGN